jgi:RNA polymerase sigma-70 factor (ECF subfamily)
LKRKIPMSEWAGAYPGSLVIEQSDLAAEFEERLRDSSTLAFRVAYGVLRNRQDAEDVAQDALTRAYRRFHQLRDRERFRAWLVRMTWRMAIDHRRSDIRRARREHEALTMPPATTAEERASSDERSQHLWRAIDELPDKFRIVVVLAAIEGQGVREVSALLQLPEGTVKSRLFLARKQLAQRLQWMTNDSATTNEHCS